MPAEGRFFDILGVSVGRVTPIYDLVHLPFDENLTALYGLNGAGKTRLLSLIEMALSGVVPDEDLDDEDGDRRDSCILDVHIQLRENGHPAIEEALAAANQRLEIALGPIEDRGNDNSLTRFVELYALDFRRRLLDHVGAHTDAGRVGEFLSSVDERATAWTRALLEAASAGRMTLRAYGISARPSWRAYVPVSASDPSGASALSACTQWVKDASLPMPNEARWNEREFDARQPISLDAYCYWQTPRFVRSAPSEPAVIPAAVQVPMVPIGRIEAATTDEVRIDLGDGRDRIIIGGREGLRLADLVGLSGHIDPDRNTLDELTSLTGQYDSGFFDAEGQVDPYIADDLASRVRLADALFQMMLPGAPSLDFRLGVPEDWLRGVRPAWYAGGMHVSKLSSAQERWAHLAIALASARQNYVIPGDATPIRRPRNPLILLCDEPERGLHRLLEHNLAHGLGEVLRRVSGVGVVATHSPDFLASSLVGPVLVSRDRGYTHVRPVPLSLVDGISSASSADTLGLSVGDLWALSRLTVVVEGVHDQWVFSSLLRGSLDAALASVFPIHGGARLRSLAEARLLVHGTDAPILVVLDEMSAPLAGALLEDIKSAAARGDQDQLDEGMERLRVTKGDSYLFLHQFVHAALEVGGLERVWVHGLSLPDVICYLPVDLVIAGELSWPDLIARWRADAAPAEPKNIKGWLRKKKLLPEDPEAINEIVRSSADLARRDNRPVHADLVELAGRIVELSHTQGSSLQPSQPGPV